MTSGWPRFCTYFFLEICIRFGAFEKKCNALMDKYLGEVVSVGTGGPWWTGKPWKEYELQQRWNNRGFIVSSLVIIHGNGTSRFCSMIFTLKPPCSYRNFPTNSHVRRSSPMFSPFEAMIAAYQRVGPTNSLFYHLPLVPFVLGLLIHCSPFFIMCGCFFNFAVAMYITWLNQ